jgi:hypothetical protein
MPPKKFCFFQACRKHTLEKGRDCREAKGVALAHFTGSFFFVAPIIKDPAFSEENEWRLVQPVASVSDPEVCFRDGCTILLPYLPIVVGGDAMPIRKVIVGPTPHPKLEERALKELLIKHGITDPCVVSSAVPYIGW